MKAVMNGATIAESDNTVVVERNHYFPMDSVRQEFLVANAHRTTCPWKGEAHYYDVVVDGARSKNAAWSYPQPMEAAKEITGHVAFWKDVHVTP
jgi:uncharacterized protein (DUF427 family)